MENKKFFVYYLPLLLATLIILGIGFTDTIINTTPGYEFCGNKGFRYMKGPLDLGKEDIIHCRGQDKVYCFDASSFEEIDCD